MMEVKKLQSSKHLQNSRSASAASPSLSTTRRQHAAECHIVKAEMESAERPKERLNEMQAPMLTKQER